MRTPVIAASLSLLAGCLAAGPAAAPVAAPPAPAAAKVVEERWEYGVVMVVPKDDLATWRYPHGETRGTSLASLYESLGGAEPDDPPTVLPVMNFLGRRGWELTDTVRDSDATMYFFKRRRS